jgi:hypothetical protein
MIIDDGTNGLLTAGIRIQDIRRSHVQPIWYVNCPGLVVGAPNSFSQDNYLWAQFIQQNSGGNHGIGIELTESGDSNTSDANWVIMPRFGDGGDDTETAYLDRGKNNMWLWTDVEHAAVCHEVNGASKYHIVEGNWDRTGVYDHTVKEVGSGVEGTIELRQATSYEKLRLVSPATTVVAKTGKQTGAGKHHPVNVLREFHARTGANDFPSMGLTDDSTGGGSVSIASVFTQFPNVDFSTGSTSNDTAVLSTGALTKPRGFPKAAFPFGPVSTGGGSDDDDSVLVRVGFFVDSTDYAELQYDPGNALGDVANTSNWNLVVKGDTVSATDVGVAPSGPGDELTIGREEDGAGNAKWHAAVNRSNTATITEPGNFNGAGEWRWYVETTAAADKSWRISGKEGNWLFRV